MPKEVKYKKCSSKAKVPIRKTSGPVDYDLYSAEQKILQPFPQDLVKTGLKMAIPENHYGRIVSCSGLALKAITTAAGFIDSDFRGVVAVVFCNYNKISCEVNVGDHIGQMIFEKYENFTFAELKYSEELLKTEIGSKGFGSSGV